MLDVKQAASTATQYFVSLYPQQNHSAVQLEEVELSEDGKYWFITLSYPLLPPMPALGTLLNVPPKREYKVFKIEAATGQVRSMKIRKLD